MGKILRAFGAGLAGKTAAPEPVPDPKGCGECGLLFASESAWSCHLEPMPGGRTRCMPATRIDGMLREVDGVWNLAGFER